MILNKIKSIFNINNRYKGIIVDIKNNEIVVCLSPNIFGRVIIQETSNDISVLTNIFDNFMYNNNNIF